MVNKTNLAKARVQAFFLAAAGGGIAALTVGLVGAVPASATPEQEYRFLQAIGSLGSSYASWPQFLSGLEPVPVGYQVCAALDRGGDPLTPVLEAAGDSRYSDYYATIFAGYAVHHLCPVHTGAVGSV
jgi:hypothetical protein